ncbi:hypothetical protein ACFYZ8_34490 [Streptomyces sp. NPDC001668]|uniref:hypothetical protein n=1 Tax=Streptomyces sp. NPDC001668 TaxID=3364598 RepID=UPI0036B2DA4B
MPATQPPSRAQLPHADRDLQEWYLGRLSYLAGRLNPYVEGEPQSSRRLRALMAMEVFSLPAALRIGLKAAEADLRDERVPQHLGGQMQDLREAVAETRLVPLLVKGLGVSYILGEEHQRALLG